ncbi:hypothetical protein TNCV_876381 [Trichonephila clavipes]|nr:hypothetical protein TNCV_876381 [Trichonephila clavipes]
MHNLSYPGIRATSKLTSKSFVWTSINKDIISWTRSCILFQRVKVLRNTNCELGHFQVPDARFLHLHLIEYYWTPSSIPRIFLLPYGHRSVFLLTRGISYFRYDSRGIGSNSNP